MKTMICSPTYVIFIIAMASGKSKGVILMVLSVSKATAEKAVKQETGREDEAAAGMARRCLRHITS